MGPEFLRASLDGDSKRAERLIEAKLPESWPFEPAVLALRLSQLEANPSWEPWLTRVIELESERRIIGVGDRTYKLSSGTTSEYGRYVKFLGDPVTGLFLFSPLC